MTLHGFCDPVYAAVIYLVVETTSAWLTKFVALKTRVTPICAQMIPRLELLSALLVARLMVTVISSLSPQLHLAEPVCYTDSKVTLIVLDYQLRKGVEAVRAESGPGDKVATLHQLLASLS